MAMSGAVSATVTPSTGVPSSVVPTSGVSLPLVHTTPPAPPPTLASIADSLASLTTAFNNVQLQMTAINHQLADQSSRLTALDGRPAFPQFGMPGFAGVPKLPVTSMPVITDVTPSAGDSSVSVFPSLPLTSAGRPESQPASAPPPTGVPLHQIQFPRSPSQIPNHNYGSIGQPLPLPASAHMASSQPYPPQAPAWEAAGVPKYNKISFETYDGQEDPLGWLNKGEQFFRGQLTREVDKVWLASYHLKGVAQQWYLVLEQDIGQPSWPDFRRYVHQRFGPAIGTNHLAELVRLPFGSSVDSYMEAFQARAAHAGELTTLQKAKLFTGGLPAYIRVDMELMEPRDLQHAMRLACTYERRNIHLRPALPPS